MLRVFGGHVEVSRKHWFLHDVHWKYILLYRGCYIIFYLFSMSCIYSLCL